MAGPVKAIQPEEWPSWNLNCMGAGEEGPPRVHTRARPAPAPAPAPAASADMGAGGLVDQLRDNPLVLPAAGGLAALLALLALLRLRKKKAGDAGPTEESRLHGESFFNASGSPPAPG